MLTYCQPPLYWLLLGTEASARTFAFIMTRREDFHPKWNLSSDGKNRGTNASPSASSHRRDRIYFESRVNGWPTTDDWHVRIRFRSRRRKMMWSATQKILPKKDAHLSPLSPRLQSAGPVFVSHSFVEKVTSIQLLPDYQEPPNREWRMDSCRQPIVPAPASTTKEPSLAHKKRSSRPWIVAARGIVWIRSTKAWRGSWAIGCVVQIFKLLDIYIYDLVRRYIHSVLTFPLTTKRNPVGVAWIPPKQADILLPWLESWSWRSWTPEKTWSSFLSVSTKEIVGGGLVDCLWRERGKRKEEREKRVGKWRMWWGYM